MSFSLCSHTLGIRVHHGYTPTYPCVAQGHFISCGGHCRCISSLFLFVLRTEPATFLLLGQAVQHLSLDRVQSLTVCPYVQTHYWPDFCQRWLCASLPLWWGKVSCLHWKLNYAMENEWAIAFKLLIFHGWNGSLSCWEDAKGQRGRRSLSD